MEREIVYAQEVEQFLDELLIILFEKGYFGFPDSAKSYVDKLLENSYGLTLLLSSFFSIEYLGVKTLMGTTNPNRIW